MTWQQKQDAKYKAMYNGGFQWLNPRWMPTALEDRIWKYTGLEHKEIYFKSRYRWKLAYEMAKEIKTDAGEIRRLLSEYGFTYQYLRYFVGQKERGR